MPENNSEDIILDSNLYYLFTSLGDKYIPKEALLHDEKLKIETQDTTTYALADMLVVHSLCCSSLYIACMLVVNCGCWKGYAQIPPDLLIKKTGGQESMNKFHIISEQIT